MSEMEKRRRELSANDLRKLVAAPRDPVTGELRGSGRSTRAMEQLPFGAVYIAPGNPDYWLRLSASINRVDITVISMHEFPAWAGANQGLPAGSISAIYFDHAVQSVVSGLHWEVLLKWLDRMRPKMRGYPDDV